jgi:hypothetical protein
MIWWRSHYAAAVVYETVVEKRHKREFMQSGASADLKRPYTFVYDSTLSFFLWLRTLGRASHPPMLAVKVKNEIKFFESVTWLSVMFDVVSNVVRSLCTVSTMCIFAISVPIIIHRRQCFCSRPMRKISLPVSNSAGQRPACEKSSILCQAQRPSSPDPSKN